MDANVERFLAKARAEDAPFLKPRFTGVPTFMRAPGTTDLTTVDIGLIGVPFDLGVTNRPGTRHGPREIRNMSSLMGFRNHQSKIIPFDLCRVGDLGDVVVDSQFMLDDAIPEIEAYYHRVVDNGVTPITAGGDHSITLPILKALGKKQPVGMVHIDAHCDTGPPRAGAKFHHGSPFFHAAEAGVLDPKRTIQIGIRGFAEHNWDYSYTSGMRVLHIEDVYAKGLPAVCREIRDVVGDGPTYVSFDVDGLDPAYAPGTGTPEIGGLNTFEAQQIIRSLQGLDLVGGDVVEVSPPFDPSGNTALVGATLMFEILCVVADATHRRRRSTSPS
jgi:guanidinopropionase